MKSATARLLAAALVIMVAPLSVRAEPVTFNYKVSVTHRCKATGIDCVPYFSSFPLTMTFDGEVIEAIDTPTSMWRRYGPATFSDVPLPLPSVPPGASDDHFTGEFAFLDGPVWGYSASARRVKSVHVSDNFYYQWSTGLFSGIDFSTAPPDFSPAAFGRPMQFDYRFIEVRNPIISQNNVVYAGTAIPDTPSPVPEPSSLVLLGSGLGAIVARKLRRRSQRLHAPSGPSVP